jgi:hypothetical protein
VNPRSTARDSDVPFVNRLIGDILIGALIFPLVVWVIELPFSIVRSLVPTKTVVEAKDRSTPPVTMRWRLDSGNVDDAVGEVAKQLEAGAQSITLPNATYLA